MYSCLGDDVGVQTVAEVDRVDVITVIKVHQQDVIGKSPRHQLPESRTRTYHSKSLYMIVKKTCRKRFTALMSTARRYSHASPDIMRGHTIWVSG